MFFFINAIHYNVPCFYHRICLRKRYKKYRQYYFWIHKFINFEHPFNVAKKCEGWTEEKNWNRRFIYENNMKSSCELMHFLIKSKHTNDFLDGKCEKSNFFKCYRWSFYDCNNVQLHRYICNYMHKCIIKMIRNCVIHWYAF